MTQDALGRIGCKGRHFVDAEGRVCLLRGANVSGRSKLPPFEPFDDPHQFDQLRGWGFNAIRLLVIWEGVQPRRDHIDSEYLDRMAILAEEAGARGLRVIVDLHQDLFSRAFGGDGAPAWVTGGQSLSPAGKTWFFRYLHPTVWKAQDAFWRDDQGQQTSFLEAFSAVVGRFSSVDAVVGYDVWNEPMAGPVAFASGRFEQAWLPEFYSRCAAIRDRVDPERLIFVEPSAVAGLGAPNRLPKLDFKRVVYAPHAYDSAALALGNYVPRLASFPGIMRTHGAFAKRQDAPMLLGEFGALNGVRNPEHMLSDECRALDRYFTSWTVWHYNPTELDWNDEGASIVGPGGTERPFTHVLVRPYPAAIAGRPIAWQTGSRKPWQLTYDATGTATTEVIVPERWSPGGYDVDVNGGDATRTARGFSIAAPRPGRVTVTLRRTEPPAHT